MARRNAKNYLGLYAFLFIVSFYLFFKFGLRLFVDWAFLITQKSTPINNSAISNNSKIALISEPILEDMPDATNEAILYIQGRASSDTQVQLFHNQSRVATANSDLEGNFQFEQVLEDRNNQFYVKSLDPYSRKSSQSKFYEVTYIDQLPNLQITNPEDGKKYYESAINIEGSTDKEVFVRINNIPVVIKADGSFSYPFTLSNGDNDIVVIAADLAGNTTEKKLRVTYVQ